MNRNHDIALPFSVNRNAGRSLIEQTTDGLRDAITCGRWKPGTILPSSRKIEERLGVSRIVVNAAFARLAEEGYIVPRPRVGTVVRDRSEKLWKGHVVMVVPPGLGNPFDTAVHAVVRDRLTAAGYLVTPVTVAETRPAHFDDFSLLDTVLRQQTDLVVQLHEQDNIARWLSKRGLPFVRIAARGAVCPQHCVGIVERRRDLALPDFAAHCREAGVRSILQVADSMRADAARALVDEGVRVATLRVPPALHYGAALALSQWAIETFRKRLENGFAWMPDLIFFQDDYIATGALLALGMAGVRIPDDVRVATWANKNFAPTFPKPLTRMEMDNAAIGETIAGCVQEWLKSGVFPEDVVVGPRYIRGETF